MNRVTVMKKNEYYAPEKELRFKIIKKINAKDTVDRPVNKDRPQCNVGNKGGDELLKSLSQVRNSVRQ